MMMCGVLGVNRWSWVVLVSLLVSPTLADEFAELKLHQWHQWRGPLATGEALHGNPPTEWSETKNIKWKKEIPGRGSATPIVWKDRIYLVTAVEVADAESARSSASDETQVAQQPERGGQRERGGRGGGRFGGRGGRGGARVAREHEFTVLCLDRESGEVIWQQVAATEVPHESLHQTNTHASSSPTTDGKRLYVSFGSRGIFCYDLEGNLLWTRNLGRMSTRNAFGEGSSPTIWDDVLVVNWDHEEQSFIVGLEADTGEIRWRVDRDELSTWATPLVVEHDGKTQVITNGSNRVRSYDLQTGELLWECGGQAANPIPSPVRRDDVVYCMTGYRGYAVFAIPLDARGDITNSSEVLWSRNDTGPYIASPVLHENILYVTKGRDAIFSSLNAETGEPHVDQQRLPGMNILYASPVAAGGRIYYVDREGTALVLKHGTDLEILATNKLEEGVDASPVVVDNQLFLRGERHLYCIQE